jgi:hypothetical protein
MRGTVLSLCDRTGNMVKPWLDAGFNAVTVDLQEAKTLHRRQEHYCMSVADTWFDWGALGPFGIIFAFPPCTHLAVSGAKHFRRKGIRSLIDALEIVEACRVICEASGAPYMIENPVSTLATYWREPDYTFHPSDFTGFELGDNYTKKTCLWVGNGFVMPKPNQAHDLPPPDDRIHKAAPGPDIVATSAPKHRWVLPGRCSSPTHRT